MSEYASRDIVVTDWIPNDGSTDVSDALQRVIDENPNRTLYFPDGTYTVSKPIITPADPRRSVSLKLSNYAVIKAADDWSDSEAMIRLGGKNEANDIETNGSNYFLEGGILDGNNRANGVSIDGGRETSIRNVSIKHTVIGVHIKYGANYGSSDADIRNVHIVGAGTAESIGVLVEGFDNTFTDMRIANVLIGFDIRSRGNFLRNIHPLFTLDFAMFDQSCGFYDHAGNNWFDMCYADNFCMSFRESEESIGGIYNSCFCFWYSSKGEKHIAHKCDGAFLSVVTNLKSDFKDRESKNLILEAEQEGGSGVFDRVITPVTLLSDQVYQAYLKVN